jgi:hypothetical protein
MTKPVTNFAASARARLLVATNRRKGDFEVTTFSPWPVALTTGFYADVPRGGQWARFLKRSKVADAPAGFSLVGERVRAFLEAPVRAVLSGEGFALSWPPGGPRR